MKKKAKPDRSYWGVHEIIITVLALFWPCLPLVQAAPADKLDGKIHFGNLFAVSRIAWIEFAPADFPPADVVDQYAKAFPVDHRVKIPRAGHLLWSDQPATYAEAIDSFLQDKPNPPSGWSRLPDMPTARLSPGMAVADGKIYVIGGGVVKGREVLPRNAVEGYDPKIGAWKVKAPLPTPRSNFGVAVLSGVIYVIGGTASDTRSSLDTVEAYDPRLDCWTSKSKLPTPRCQTGAAVLDHRIYVVGGNAGHERAFEVYDPERNQWTTLPPLPKPWRNAGVAAQENRIVALGGVETDGWTPSAAVASYSPKNGQWIPLANLPFARTDFAVVPLRNKILAVGGFHNGPLANLDEYDLDLGKWTAHESVSVPLHHHAAVALEGKIYVAGGTSKLPEASASFYCYDPPE